MQTEEPTLVQPEEPTPLQPEEPKILPCPSKDQFPENCENKKQQWKMFHPDKNPGCLDQSTDKFKMLTKVCNGESITKEINEYNKKYGEGEFYTLMMKPELQTSQKSTEKMRHYFDANDYYFMIDQLFQNMTSEQQIFLKKIFLRPLGLDPTKYKTIDKDVYTRMVDQLTVEENSGKGDCFFIALANAINLYNSRLNDETQFKERIVYTNYGKNIPFTQKSLRTLVANVLLQPDLVDHYLLLGELNAENLNDLYKQTFNVTTEKSEKNLKQLIDDLYTSNDNFLVKKIDDLPEYTEDIKPFTKVTKEEIRTYAESSYYWADNTTIEIVLKELNINVIVIENNKNKIQLPFPNLKTTTNQGIKYVFFYYENAHYELITFSTTRASGNQIQTGIFTYPSPRIPPIYVLFLLFSLYYLSLTSTEQPQIELFKEYFKMFKKSFDVIYQKTLEKENKKSNFVKMFKKDSEEMKFIKSFNQYFNTNKNSNVNKEYPLLKEFKGGAGSEDSMLSYYITITLELYKGENITDEQIKKGKCRQKWNSVRQSYAKLTNKKYVIPPVYEKDDSSVVTAKNSTAKNSTAKNLRNEKKNKTMKNKK